MPQRRMLDSQLDTWVGHPGWTPGLNTERHSGLQSLFRAGGGGDSDGGGDLQSFGSGAAPSLESRYGFPILLTRKTEILVLFFEGVIHIYIYI